MAIKLNPVEKQTFAEWKVMRRAVYGDLDEAFDKAEMENIYQHDNWFCYFIVDALGVRIGLVELSSRNIVDGCLSSPVAYLEGLYLKPEYREKGVGKLVMQHVFNWCAKKGFSELATDTELENTRAQSFYDMIGFEETYKVVQFRIDIAKY